VAAKSGQFTTRGAGKGQFLRGNRGNLTKERRVRKISSPGGIFFCLIYAIKGDSELGTSARGSVASVLPSLPINYQGVQHDRGPTGILELHKGVERNQLGKRSIESGIS